MVINCLFTRKISVSIPFAEPECRGHNFGFASVCKNFFVFPEKTRNYTALRWGLASRFLRFTFVFICSPKIHLHYIFKQSIVVFPASYYFNLLGHHPIKFSQPINLKDDNSGERTLNRLPPLRGAPSLFKLSPLYQFTSFFAHHLT